MQRSRLQNWQTSVHGPPQVAPSTVQAAFSVAVAHVELPPPPPPKRRRSPRPTGTAVVPRRAAGAALAGAAGRRCAALPGAAPTAVGAAAAAAARGDQRRETHEGQEFSHAAAVSKGRTDCHRLSRPGAPRPLTPSGMTFRSGVDSIV